MCIVLDASTWYMVFDENNAQHERFKPVKVWIIAGRGKVVYGGSKYSRELKKSPRILKIFRELEKFGKTVKKSDKEIDEVEKEVENRVKGLNDGHLVGIIAVTGCRLICVEDKEARPYLRDKGTYPGGVKRPKLYTGNKKNESLLTDMYITEVCEPVQKGTKDLRKLFGV